MPVKTPDVAGKAQVLLGSSRADTFPGVQNHWQWEAFCFGEAPDTPGEQPDSPFQTILQ